MSDVLVPGTMAAFSGSMAAAIEAALDTLIQQQGRPALSMDDSLAEVRDRRVLLLAISQGVVAHLAAHHEAFTVTGLNPGAGTPVVHIAT